jgi:hypothetical protein
MGQDLKDRGNKLKQQRVNFNIFKTNWRAGFIKKLKSVI